ncbi:MAG: DUF4397 domain-containing protein [Ktedonobacterales bacterium]
MRTKLSRIGAAGVLALGLSLAVIVGSGTASAHASGGTAYVRLIHAAFLAPSVDVYLDNATKPLVAGFAFGQFTDYWPVAAGTHTLALAPAGQGASAAVISGTETFDAGKQYTVAAVGDSSVAPALKMFQDDNTVASGMSKVRVYHLSSDAGLAGVTADGQTIIPAVNFEQASGYLTLKPGNYNIGLVIQQGAKTVPLTLTLQANKVMSVFGVGQVAGSTFKFVVATANADPTALPPTGFNPHPATARSGGAPVGLFAVLLTLLAALGGGFGALYAERRARSAPAFSVRPTARRHRSA